MQEISSTEKIPNLIDLGNVVPEGYVYYKKKIIPGLLLNLRGASLKWYNLYPPDTEITKAQVQETRAFIESEVKTGRLKFENELGFVILHRAGDYLLLLITTWRNTNEMWESVYFKKAAQTESYTPVISKNDLRATYCVWELGAVWHERNAWVRFIESKRDEEAKLVYLNDVFAGEV
jgi:hypothetical protein